MSTTAKGITKRTQRKPKVPGLKAPAGRPARVRSFVFTVNNYTDEEVKLIAATSDVKWLIAGREICPTTGTPHLQGACCIGRQVPFSQLSTWPGFKRAFLQRMNGKPYDSFVYCSKSDPNFIEIGSRPQPGKRNDLRHCAERLQTGMSVEKMVREDVASAVCFVKYNRGLIALRSLYRNDRPLGTKPVVIWLHGPTGVGKSKWAVETAERLFPGDWWISSGSLRWFCGYDGQPAVIFDDYRTKHAEFSQVLRLLDRLPCRVEVKGGSVKWIPRLIIITAPYSPRTMWDLRTPEDLNQLTRRITLVLELPLPTNALMPSVLCTSEHEVVVSLLPGSVATVTELLEREQQSSELSISDEQPKSQPDSGSDTESWGTLRRRILGRLEAGTDSLDDHDGLDGSGICSGAEGDDGS